MFDVYFYAQGFVAICLTNVNRHWFLRNLSWEDVQWHVWFQASMPVHHSLVATEDMFEFEVVLLHRSRRHYSTTWVQIRACDINDPDQLDGGNFFKILIVCNTSSML